jgi:DNA-binding Lrp family transcriptional regulator
MSRAPVDDVDRKLIGLLRDDARQSVTGLGHALGLSRASVYARIERLEKRGVIQGYTVRLGEAFGESLIRAHVMVKLSPKQAKAIEKKLVALPQLVTLHATSGVQDMIAILEAASIAELNRVIDVIGALDGVESTLSSIVLDTKVSRQAFIG